MRLLLIISSLLILTGCCMIHNGTGKDINNREISSGSENLKNFGNKILESLQKKDYSSFAKCVDDKENKISEEEFRISEKNLREQFGRITGYEYLTDLELPLMHNMIWKVRFERKGKNQDTVKQELLFRLVLGTINGKPHVISMGFL